MFGQRSTVRIPAPRIPFETIARSVLGPRYELSLVLCGDKLARKLNKKHRGKTYAANVLSFPYDQTSGEIFLNVRTATREAKRYRVPVRDRIALLFVHGCYHLKGFEHGREMEALEIKTLRRFGLSS